MKTQPIAKRPFSWSKWIKTFRWNFGIEVIRFGYRVRNKFWKAGASILGIGYKFRGEIPMKDWWKKKVMK